MGGSALSARKSSGLLLHVTALPSPYGIGDFGQGAYEFIDFLAASGQRYWQILPLNPVSSIMGYSPYSSFAARAINPMLASPDLLAREGLIGKEELLGLPVDPSRADFPMAEVLKERMFDRAFAVFEESGRRVELEAFCEVHKAWIEDYALFKVLDGCFPGCTWNQWPAPLRDRDPSALAAFAKRYARVIAREKFVQFLAWRQWEALRLHARKKGVSIIGDLPLYVSHHSVDVWSARELFRLDREGRPTHVAGVPPDYFCEDGQLWGNPVYDWRRHEKQRFSWWVERVRANLSLFDLLRVDHFRGLVAYWEVPAGEATAKSGTWVPVPVDAFLGALRRELGEIPVIAEDLGVISDDVREVMTRYGLPGMKVLIFAFHNEKDDNPYLPPHIKEESVVYTGTHDNNTAQGWFEEEASDEEKRLFRKYAKLEEDPEEPHWELIRLAMETAGRLVIMPVQDVLGLGSESRFNTPGVATGNWAWRLEPGALDAGVLRRLSALTAKAGR